MSNSRYDRYGSRIVVTLDVDDVRKAISVFDALMDHVLWVKVGLELITAQIARTVCEEAAYRGFRVLWDGKLNDVPRTVGKAVREASKHPGVGLINVHASNNIEGMLAAVENRGSAEILAVTALASIDTENVELEFGHSRNAKVLQYARNAAYAGCRGLICSPKELGFLNRYSERKLFPEKPLACLKKVIAETRSPGADTQDQKNVETLEVAILGGADLVVIGSELLSAKDPAEAVQVLNMRIAQALVERASAKSQKGAVTV